MVSHNQESGHFLSSMQIVIMLSGLLLFLVSNCKSVIEVDKVKISKATAPSMESASVTANEITLAWSAVSKASYYIVIIASDASCETPLSTITVTNTSASFNFSIGSSKAYACVEAFESSGKAIIGAVIKGYEITPSANGKTTTNTATTTDESLLSDVPEDVRNLGASIGKSAQIRIVWEPPFFGEIPAAYAVYRSTTSSVSRSGTPLAVVIGSEYIDTTAVNGTLYYYLVVARSSGGIASAGVLVSGLAMATSASRNSSLLFVDSIAASGGDGSIASPYNSIDTAINSVDEGGVVVLLPGIFRITSSIAIGKSVTLRSQQGAYEASGGVTLRGPNRFEENLWTSGFPAVIASSDGVTVAGLNFTQFYIVNPNTNQSAMIHHGGSATPIKNLVIHNNRFFKNNANVTSSASYGANDRDNQTGWQVTSNYVGEMTTDGNSILAHYWKNCLIKDNVIINSNFAGIQTLGIRECVITRNHVVKAKAYAIKIGCGTGAANCQNITVTKNVLVGTLAASYSGSMRLSPLMLGTLTVRDNIIQNSAKSAVYFDSGGHFDGFTFVFKNNRFENSAQYAFLNTTTTGTVDATQNWWGSSSGPGVTGDDDSESISAGSAAVNPTSYLTSAPNPRFAGGITLVSVAISTWSTTPRGSKQLNALGTFSDASTMDLTAHATWTTSDADTVAVSDVSVTKGQATAVRAGTATITAMVDGKIGTLAVTVNRAPLIAQLGGNTNGGYQKINTANGSLIGAQFVTGRTVLRSMFSIPGGFISGACATPNLEFFDYTGAIPSSPLLLGGFGTDCPHGISLTSDNYLLVANYTTSKIQVHKLSDGSLISQFGTGDLLSPFRAIELNDGRIIAGSWAGKLVAYSRVGTTVTKIGDFATGFNQVWGLEYCSRYDQILVSEYGNRRVSSCTSSGSCSVLANHGKSGPLGIRLDINAGDCSFYVSFEDGQIRRFAANGTPDAAATPLATMTQKVYDFDFEWPSQ